jgi:hypothetical protein
LLIVRFSRYAAHPTGNRATCGLGGAAERAAERACGRPDVLFHRIDERRMGADERAYDIPQPVWNA